MIGFTHQFPRLDKIYYGGAEVEIVSSPESIDCDDVSPGFCLDLSSIWE